MDPSQALKDARQAAGLSQRDLAKRTRVAQPAIARIESGKVSPGIETLDHLLRACGRTLRVADRHGVGVDRTVIRRLIKLSPRERLDLAVAEATHMKDLLGKIETI